MPTKDMCHLNVLLRKAFLMTKQDFINRGSGVALEFTPPNYLSFHFAKISMCHKNYIASYNNSLLQTSKFLYNELSLA